MYRCLQYTDNTSERFSMGTEWSHGGLGIFEAATEIRRLKRHLFGRILFSTYFRYYWIVLLLFHWTYFIYKCNKYIYMLMLIIFIIVSINIKYYNIDTLIFILFLIFFSSWPHCEVLVLKSRNSNPNSNYIF